MLLRRNGCYIGWHHSPDPGLIKVLWSGCLESNGLKYLVPVPKLGNVTYPIGPWIVVKLL